MFRHYEHSGIRNAEPWINWITRFEAQAKIAPLTDEQTKYALAGCMKGRASQLTQDIDIDLDAATQLPITYLAVKEAYESRFITPGESSIAKADFLTCKQKEHEDELDWHSRARALFSRAYPNRDANTSTDLIMRFIQGLRHRILAHFVQDGLPESYVMALDRCLHKKATCELLPLGRQDQPMEIGAVGTRQARPIPEPSSADESETDGEEINAFGKTQARKTFRKGPGRKRTDKKESKGHTKSRPSTKRTGGPKKKPKCYWCKETGHFQRQCPRYIQCHLTFLSEKGIDIEDSDMNRTRMEIGALDDGVFEPRSDPYETQELQEHLGQLPEVFTEEEDF